MWSFRSRRCDLRVVRKRLERGGFVLDDVFEEGDSEEVVADVPGIECKRAIGIAHFGRVGADLAVLDHLVCTVTQAHHTNL